MPTMVGVGVSPNIRRRRRGPDAEPMSYYFSSSLGSNSTGDGSIENPWQNFAGVADGIRFLRPGDTCYFKAGDVWTQQEIKVNSNGASGRPIKITRYGDGPNPIFRWAQKVEDWTYTGANNIYSKTGMLSWPGTVGVNGTSALCRWTGSNETLVAGSWKISGTTLYIRLADNSDPALSDIYVPTANQSNIFRGIVSGGSQYGAHTTFEDLEIQYSQGMGFSLSQPFGTFKRLKAIGTGKEGFLFNGYKSLGELANYARAYDCLAEYCNSGGTGHGQAYTTYASYTWWIRCTARNNFMAGFDFLDYDLNNSEVEYSGMAYCVAENNGRWLSNPSYDPNIYIDGASNIYVYGCVISGAGNGTGTAGNARSGIAAGSEHEYTHPVHDIYFVNNLVSNNKWIAAGFSNLTQSIENISNIFLFNNTFIAKRSGYNLVYNPASLNETLPDTWVAKNNIFYAMSSASVYEYINNANLANYGVWMDSDYNLFFRHGGGTTVYRDNTNNINYTLAQWQAGTGIETNSAYGDPRFITNTEGSFDVRLQRTALGQANDSPAVGMAEADPFTPPQWVIDANVIEHDGYVYGTTRSDNVLTSTAGETVDVGYHYPIEPLILNDLPSGYSGWSLSKINADYNGPAITVRRSSDSTSTDIGFVDGQLDTATLLTFCGAGDGFVTRMFDQSGGGQDLTVTTFSSSFTPKIVTGGALSLEDEYGNPMIRAFSGGSAANNLRSTTAFPEGDNTVFAYAMPVSGLPTANINIFGGTGSSGANHRLMWNSAGVYGGVALREARGTGGSPISTGTSFICSFINQPEWISATQAMGGAGEIWQNGQAGTLTASHPTFEADGTITLGFQYVSSASSNVGIHTVIVGPGIVADDIRKSVSLKAKTLFSLPDPYYINVIGDSLTQGNGAVGRTYPQRLRPLLATDQIYQFRNTAIGGSFVQTVQADAETAPNGINYQAFEWPATEKIAIIWCGTNNLGGIGAGTDSDPAVTYGRLEALVESVSQQIAWDQVAVVTGLPRQDNTKTTLIFAYNDLIRDGFEPGGTMLSKGATALIDINTLPEFDADGDYNNTTYFNADKIHLEIPGYDVIVSLLQSELNLTRFTPNSISDMALWLSAGTGQTTATGLDSWANQAATGSGYDATQGTGGAQPALGAVTLNGFPGVTFDGVDDFLELSGAGLDLFRNVSGYTVVTVLRFPSAASEKRWLNASVGTTNNSTRVSVGVTATDVFTGFARRLDADGGSSQLGNFGYVAGTDRIITNVGDLTNTDAFNYSNGSIASSNSAFLVAGSTSDTASQVVNIGCSAQGTFFFDGTIFEMLVYKRALTEWERNTVGIYLSNKYGIALT